MQIAKSALIVLLSVIWAVGGFIYKTGWIVENSESGLYSGLKHLLDNPALIEKLRSNKGMEKICRNDEKYRKMMTLLFGERK